MDKLQFSAVKVKDIADIKTGYQSKTRIHEEALGTHFLIQGNNIDSTLTLNDRSLIRFLPENSADNYLLEKNDILFQARGSENYACLIEKDISNTFVSGSFYTIRIRNSEVHPRYLTWWLNQPYVQKSFQSVRSGTLISYVSLKALSEIQVPIPPYSIQKQIAQVFDLWKKEEILVKNLLKSRKILIQAICKKSVKKSIKEIIDTSKGGQQ